MFGIGMPELILIMAIALIVIGPKKLPDLARSLGRALGEFKKATGELKSSLGVDEELGDVKHAFDEMNQDIKDAVNVNPLQPTDKNTGQTVPDKTDPDKTAPDKTAPDKTDRADSVSVEKLAEEGVTPDSQTESPDDVIEKTAEPAEREAYAFEIDETDSLKETIAKKNRGESVGDE